MGGQQFVYFLCDILCYVTWLVAMRLCALFAVLAACSGWSVPKNVPTIEVCRAEEILKRSDVEAIDYLKRCGAGERRVKRGEEAHEFEKRCGSSIEELIEKKSADDIITFMTRCGTGVRELLNKRTLGDALEVLKRCGGIANRVG